MTASRACAAAVTGLLVLMSAALAVPAGAAEDCLIVTELKTARVVAKQGLCAARHSPVTTFDIPLALMGYDSGFLRSASEPALAPAPGTGGASADAGRLTPQGWVRTRTPWYGQEIAKSLGKARLAAYLKSFFYGNENLSGEPGRDNGLTEAWLSSSLAISPREQADFLRRMLNGDLAVSPDAVGRAVSLFKQPETLSGYDLYGTQGTGYLRLADASIDRTRPLGWFVGWLERDRRAFVFVRFMSLDIAVDEPLGDRARRQTLTALDAIIRAQEP